MAGRHVQFFVALCMGRGCACMHAKVVMMSEQVNFSSAAFIAGKHTEISSKYTQTETLLLRQLAFMWLSSKSARVNK